MEMSKQNINPIILELSHNDPVVSSAVSYAFQMGMSEKEFLILLVEALVNIKNKLNDELIDTILNGVQPIRIVDTSNVEWLMDR